MSDLISRQATIDALEAKKDKTAKGTIGQFYNTIIQHDIDALIDLPTIDAVEVVHGEWEVVDQEEPKRYGCSVCKRLSFYVTNYCSCCGAKMDGEREC